MTGLSHTQREVLKAWPEWVYDLRKRKFKVASRATQDRLALGTGKDFNPDAAYMYRQRSVRMRGERSEHLAVTYYRFTKRKAPEQFDKEIWR